MFSKPLAAFAAFLAFTFSTASAATVVFDDRTAFTAALGGATPVEEDFGGASTGDNLNGVEFLPGVSATTNADRLEVFGGANSMFATGGDARTNENLFYDLMITGYNAFGFDIVAYNPDEGPGVIEITFEDSSTMIVNISPTNATESDPLFFGVISDLAIVSIVWREGVEMNGGNEETALDNFIAANVSEVPIPPAVALFLIGLAGLRFAQRRRA